MKYKLKEICSITKGATGIMKASGGKYPLVALSDTRRSHNEFQFDANAVIVPLISSTGHGHASMKRVHYQEGKFALGSILCAVIPNDETQLNAKYLHLYLQQFKETLLVPLMRGAANVSLPMNKLADVEIEVPGFERQLEIIALEDKAAELKNELEEKLFLQDGDVVKLRQALLREAMQGKLTKQNLKDGNAKDLLEKIKAEKTKFSKKEKPLAEIKEEEIPFDIPENWVWCKLGELAYITSGSTPSQDAFVPKGIPYLKMYNLRNQKIDFFHKPQYIKAEVHNGQLKRCRAFSGDVLMNIVGPPLGKIAIIPDDLPECNFNQAAVLIRPLIKEMNLFVFCYLNEMSEINSIETKGVAGQNNISVTQAHNMRIPLPPLPEQNRIVKKLEELMKLCDDLQASIQASKTENEKLLQGALRDALRKEELVTA